MHPNPVCRHRAARSCLPVAIILDLWGGTMEALRSRRPIRWAPMTFNTTSGPRSKDFVSLAASNNIWVHLEFATDRPNREIAVPGSQAAALGRVTALGSISSSITYRVYQKVLIWGLNYGIGESPTGAFWSAAYP